LLWSLWEAVGGAVIGFYLAFRIKVPTLSLAEWLFPVVGAVAASVILSLVWLIAIRARMPTTIYDELTTKIATLESEYKATHPHVHVSLESIAKRHSASLSIVNSGSTAEFQAKLIFVEGNFQSAPRGGPFLAQWQDGRDHMVIPQGSSTSLRIAKLERTEIVPAKWTIYYFDHGAEKTVNLFYLSEVSTPATIIVELQANPGLPDGPVSTRLTFLGDTCREA